ncbi:GyrI-like domain-containing protein [Rouxiella sp. T17]|uniref:GyrI-like domain-containing protein n=1 Tax=Rouxiella sp. T17 TaxID=3085684 RepID=UPI002FCAD9FB
MILEKPTKTVASYRVVGPYEQSVKQGFAALTPWAEKNGLGENEWLTIFWDNPLATAPEARRADASVSVDEHFTLGENAEGIELQTLPAGTYAAFHTTVDSENFAQAWTDFIEVHLASSGYRPDGRACYEQYLNDGRQTGVFEVVFYLSVTAQ